MDKVNSGKIKREYPFPNTVIEHHEDGHKVVYLYDTCIILVNPKGDVVLATGGHFTQTTKRRMNQVAKRLKLGITVFSNGNIWHAQYRVVDDEANTTDAAVSSFNGNIKHLYRDRRDSRVCYTIR